MASVVGRGTIMAPPLTGTDRPECHGAKRRRRPRRGAELVCSAVARSALMAVRGNRRARRRCPTGLSASVRHQGGAALSPRPATRNRARTTASIHCATQSPSPLARTYLPSVVPGGFVLIYAQPAE